MRITPRLRVTAGLSLLALLAGVAGTHWLSGRTGEWAGPTHPVVAVHVAPPPGRYRAERRTRHPPVPRSPAVLADAPSPPAPAAPTILVPLQMPPLQARYVAVRDHLDGQLVLALAVDGEGRVQRAVVRRSSGDPVLDDYARALVRGWRFAVPPDRPGGLEGELPMRFGSQR